MGAVWRGVHLQRGQPVAVKVLSLERAREPRALATFRREVRAVARLNHNAIVSVLDHGIITPAAAYEARGRLVAGSPFLVMELAEATLATQHTPATWEGTQDALVRLLGALAHAHARGIVHRDLKPANVLWVRRAPHYPMELKLTDFGLAHVVTQDQTDGRARAAGTPAYMAPEQFRGSVRDFGPWTDLYALGCLAFQLASGHRPFVGESEHDYANAHLHRKPPTLHPLHAIPPGFDAWVERLLDKNPMARFRCAADALFALQELGAPQGERPTDPDALSFPETSRESWTVDEAEADPTEGSSLTSASEPSRPPPEATVAERNPWDDRPASQERRSVLARSALAPSRSERSMPTVATEVIESEPAESTWVYSAPPPLPQTWHAPQEVLPVTLLGAGLGLFGVREVPLVGRRATRDKMWQMLRTVREGGRPKVLVLEGPSGFGKTRLATWFSERAHEVGSGEILRTKHDPNSENGDALIALAQNHLNTRGLDRQMVRSRVRKLLRAEGVDAEEEWQGLSAMLSPAAIDESDAVRIVQPSARFGLLLRMLQRATKERPAVVVFDDVQWDPLTLYFIEYVLDDCPETFPALMVLTVQEEAIAERPVEQSLLEMMHERPEVERLRVGPLEDEEHRNLVSQMLRFENELTNEIAQRTAGNPLFATQLIGDWVHRGILKLTKRGFVLREGASAELPDDLYSVWNARIERAVQDIQDGRVALELAATFGRVVPVDEWRTACVMMRLDVPREFLSDLLRSQLMEPEDPFDDSMSKLGFVHGMLREALERSARERDLLPHLHGAVADVLRPKLTHGELEVAERLAYHLRRANRLREAVQPLRVAADQRRKRGEFERALRLLDAHSETLVDTETPERHDEWAHNLLMRTEILWKQGTLTRSSRLADEALELTASLDNPSLRARALYLRGYLDVHQGKLDSAEPLLFKAAQEFDLLGERVDSARAMRALAYSAISRGDPHVAYGAYFTALETCRAYDDLQGAAASLAGLGFSCEDNDAGLGHLEEALGLFERVGDLFGVASTLNNLADRHRRRGEMTEAEGLYRRAVSVSQRVGAAHLEASVVVGLALVLIHAHRFGEAERELEVAWRMAELLGHAGTLASLHAVSLPCAAMSHDQAAWAEHADRLTARINAQAVMDVDVVAAIELAGDLSEAAGEMQRARTAWTLAARLFASAGAKERAAMVRAKATD